MSQQNPIRIFVTHFFTEHPDYHRVFEYLENASNFFYTNCSAPGALPPAATKESMKDALLAQIRAAEVVVVVSSMYTENRELLTHQINAAEAAGIPIVALEPFGGTGSVREEIKAKAKEVTRWNDRDIVDALKRAARNEDTARWEVIEFDMS